MKTKQLTFMGFPKKIDFEAIERKRIAKAKKERDNALKTLLRKRFLVKDYSTISEYVLLEISPSGSYCLLMNNNGKKEWRSSDNIKPLELIGNYRKKMVKK